MISPAMPRYSFGEEVANSVTHGVGIVLAIAGLAVLTAFAARNGTAWHVTASAIFGATLILCFTASTLYHSIQNDRIKQVLRVFDHSAVFLLIAGTYTPFMLIGVPGPWGWTILTAVWTLAVTGVVLKFVLRGRLHGLIVALYLAMGWLVVVATRPLLENIGAGGMTFLAGGGLAYTVGVIFYKWRRLPYSHAIWHGFVLLGGGLHYFGVLFYLIP
ncbi:MAG: hemolysin III family protein [Rhodocyclales bacterium]|nr:hemolysin III family protein [Rhodocyclales bacterium]